MAEHWQSCWEPLLLDGICCQVSGVVQVEGGVAKLLARQAAALAPTGVMAEPNSLWLNGAPLPDMPALQAKLGYGIQFELQRLQVRWLLYGVSFLAFPIRCQYSFPKSVKFYLVSLPRWPPPDLYAPETSFRRLQNLGFQMAAVRLMTNAAWFSSRRWSISGS